MSQPSSLLLVPSLRVPWTRHSTLSSVAAFSVRRPVAYMGGQCGEEGLDSLLRFDAFRPLCRGGPIVLYCTCVLGARADVSAFSFSQLACLRFKAIC